MRTALLALLAALAIALAVPSVALAVDPPDTLAFEPTGSGSAPAVTVYRDLIEDGGMLIVGQYNIAYTTLPDDGADVNFIGQALDNVTSVGASVPYPYTDQGYGKGVISWYLSPTVTEAQGWWDSGTSTWSEWGATLTTLGVDLSTNPALFLPADQRTAVVSPIIASAFSTGSGQSTNQTQLANKLLDIGAGLEAAWGIVLFDDNGRLNATGALYFQRAIPGILSMAPTAFGSSSQSPTIPTPQPTPGGAGTIAETAEQRFDGTFWLTPAFNATGTTLGLPSFAFQGILTAVTILIVTGIGMSFGGSGGAAMGFAVGSGVVLPIFTVLGFVSWGYGVFAIGILVVAGIIRATRDWFA